MDPDQELFRLPTAPRWGRDFDPDRLARLELGMWKAYYRRQRLRLFGLLVLANREQAQASWPRALLAALYLARAAAGFGRATGDYERFAGDIARGYRTLGLPPGTDAEEVARRELRWWVVRRETGLDSAASAGEAITRLYSAVYGVAERAVAERAGCAAGPPRCVIAERRPIRMARPVEGRRTGPKSDACSGSRTAACVVHSTTDRPTAWSRSPDRRPGRPPLG